MPRQVRPTGNARRQLSYDNFDLLSKKRPEKSLTVSLRSHGGRDDSGQVSVRHQGAGAKRLYRVLDWKMADGTAKVLALEYDPNRSAFIALMEKESSTDKKPGKKFYMLAPEDLRVGETVSFQAQKRTALGNRARLADLPVGTEVYNVELRPGQGGQLCRAAGTGAVISAKEGKYAHLRMPSSEVRKILLECKASVGRASNIEHNRVRYAKAGRVRHMGVRPTVRGKAMYPAAHPHGGGEGVNPIGLKQPKTPWGKPARGVKTRRNKRTNIFIVSRRKK